MIDDLSKTLRTIVTQPGLEAPLSESQIAFDRPDDKFNPQQTTVNFFLYDVREDVNLRSNEQVVVRQNGNVTTRHPPLRIACSYLVTAWPMGGLELALQEQRLLSQVLQVFSRLPTIPSRFLQGSLAGQVPPLPMMTALVDPQKNLSEFWAALGNKLRPSLTVVATLALDIIPPETSRMVISEQITIGDLTSSREPTQEAVILSTGEHVFHFGGCVTDKDKMPIKNARVDLPDQGIGTFTDDRGYYNLSVRRRGSYQCRVQSDVGEKRIDVEVPPPDGKRYDVQLTKEDRFG